MILVTGATGALGAGIISHLLKKGVAAGNIAALVRDKAKGDSLARKGVHLRTGDYSDPASLVHAFAGIDKLMLVSSNDRGAIENRTLHHRNAIHAAVEAGVKHIIYTSFVRKTGYEHSAIAAFQQSHVDTETLLKNSQVSHTILQNGIYMEMIPVFAGKAMETGTLNFPAGQGKAGWVLRDELAAAAAHVLITTGHENKTYLLTNTEPVSFAEIAGDMAVASGTNIRYQSPGPQTFATAMQDAGVPDAYTSLFTMWAAALAEGALDITDDTLSSFLGRKPATVSQFIHSVYQPGGKGAATV